MTERDRQTNEATPAAPTADAVDGASGSTVRASHTEAMAQSGEVATPTPATPFERVASAAPQSQPRRADDGLPPFMKPAPAAAPEAAPPAAAPEVAPQAPAPEATAPSDEAPSHAATPAPSTGAAASPPDGLPEGPSPWSSESSEEQLDASLLPSANLEALASAPADSQATKPTPPKHSDRADRSRSALVVGLAVAALVLLGAMIYIGTRTSGTDDGPASVKLGSDGTPLDPEDTAAAAPSPTATASSSASTKPATPRPIMGKGRLPRTETGKTPKFLPDDI